MKNFLFIVFILVSLNGQIINEKIIFQSANPFSFHDVITDGIWLTTHLIPKKFSRKLLNEKIENLCLKKLVELSSK